MKIHKQEGTFEPVSAGAWKQQIQADLKGGDYNALLTWLSPEGIAVKPFYTGEDLPENRTTSPGPDTGGWQIGHPLESFDTDSLALAREALENGVDGVLAVLDSKNTAVVQELAGLGGTQWLDIRHLDDTTAALPGQVRGGGAECLFDPVGTLAATGNWAVNREKDMSLLGSIGNNSPENSSLAIHMDLYQNAGANRVQELAYGLSHAHEYVLQAESDPEVAGLLQNPVFLVAVGNEYFFEIAKIRTLRRLWALLARAHGLPGTCRIFAHPTRRNKTLYDYNTNMLRTTTECMAAVLGGADLVVNFPYDGLYHAPNGFAARIGRNQLLLLRHESYFDKVANPADGAYYIESLTEDLGEKALALFKNLEKAGGLLQQLKEHKIQKKIRESERAQQQAFDEGRLVLVGSNKYPNPEDRMKEDLQVDPFPPKKPRKTLIEPLLPKRLSRACEQKRLRDE